MARKKSIAGTIKDTVSKRMKEFPKMAPSRKEVMEAMEKQKKKKK